MCLLIALNKFMISKFIVVGDRGTSWGISLYSQSNAILHTQQYERGN